MNQKQTEPNILAKKKQFGLQKYHETALANASVEELNYLFHDRQLKKKVDKLINLVSGKLPKNVQYVSVQLLDGKAVGVFRDHQNTLLLNDQAGSWYKIVSDRSIQLTNIQFPFQ